MADNRAGRALLVRGLRCIFALAALAYVFSQVPVGDVSAILRRADPLWAATAFASAMLVQVCMAKRLRLLTDAQDLDIGTFEVLAINLGIRFYGLFLPGGGITATALRVMQLARVKKNYSGSIIAVALDRVVTTATMALVGLVFGLMAGRPGQTTWIFAMGALFALLGAPLFWLSLRRGRTDSPRCRISAIEAGPLERVKAQFAGAAALPSRSWPRVLGWSVLAHLIGTADHMMLAWALDLEIGFAAIGWVRSVMLAATLLPVSVAGLGVREGAAILMLSVYGIAPDAALAFSLLVFTCNHLCVGVVGGVLEALRRDRKS